MVLAQVCLSKNVMNDMNDQWSHEASKLVISHPESWIQV